MTRGDWIYLFGLLVPLTAYDLSLKAVGVLRHKEATGLFENLGLMRSDLLFHTGYAIFWIGLFAVARTGMLRRVVTALFHVVSLLVVAVATVAYQYFESTGSTLDWNVLVFYLGTLGEVWDIIASEAPLYVWVLLAGALLYALIGPWLATRVFLRRVGERSWNAPRQPYGMVSTGLCLIAIGLGSLSLAPGTVGASRSFSLDPVVNVFATGVGAPDAEELQAGTDPDAVSPLTNARLRETPRTEKRNVVLISLESTRSRSVTPYNEDLKTTPFLDELAAESLLIEWAYTTLPHTSKALTSVNCGIYPDTDTEITESSKPGAVPARCLAELLGEQGYNTAWFQSATGTFEDRPQLTENLGYDEFYGLEDIDKEGFEKAGYLGYEDDIMLEPSRKWLEENGDQPFMVTYDTITPHHEYLAPDRYGRLDLAEDDVLNRYLNSVRYVDFFVKNLIEQYKDLGLYEDTVFVIMGDHGEAFGEHGVKGHDGVPYEEGLRVPFIIHDPQRWQDGERIEDAPTNQLDVAPTVLDLLGFEVADGDYPGASLLGPLHTERPLFASCRPDLLCMASIEGDKKYIYHYGKRPGEYYDLSEDPLEKKDIVGKIPQEELDRRREELLEWRSATASLYDKLDK